MTKKEYVEKELSQALSSCCEAQMALNEDELWVCSQCGRNLSFERLQLVDILEEEYDNLEEVRINLKDGLNDDLKQRVDKYFTEISADDLYYISIEKYGLEDEL